MSRRNRSGTMATGSKRKLFLLAPTIAVFYVIIQLNLVKPPTTNELELKHPISTNDTDIDSTSIVKQQKKNKKNSCVSLSLDNDNEKEEKRGIITLESLLRNDDGILQQVFITMPSKAAGTTMIDFMHGCMSFVGNTAKIPKDINMLNFKQKGARMDFLYDKDSHKNTIIASHLEMEDSLHNLIQNMPYSAKRTSRGSLLIYIHRGETDRLVSAIHHILTSSVCGKKNYEKNPWAQETFKPTNMHRNETHCIVNEEDFVKVISEKRGVISQSGNRQLTCKTYETLKENNPLSYFDDDDSTGLMSGGVLFMDYSQVDKLQKVLEKHHCPGMLSSLKSGSGAIHANTAERIKIQVLIRRRDDPNGGLVSVNDWVEEKRMILEWTLDLKGSHVYYEKEASCQSTTRRIEEKMYQCPDETMILPNSLL